MFIITKIIKKHDTKHNLDNTLLNGVKITKAIKFIVKDKNNNAAIAIL